VLDTFAAVTGLHINFEKSTFVPFNVDLGESAAILGCPTAAFSQNYIGLPLSHAKIPASVLDEFAVRVERRIPGVAH
jgi:hypothetical protein